MVKFTICAIGVDVDCNYNIYLFLGSLKVSLLCKLKTFWLRSKSFLIEAQLSKFNVSYKNIKCRVYSASG